MDFINYHLCQFPADKLVYFVGIGGKSESFISTLKSVCFEKMLLVFEDSEDKEDFFEECAKELEEGFEKKFEIVEKNELKINKNEFVFVFDHYKSISEMGYLCDYKPIKVVGFFEYGYKTFALWEHLRTKVERIYLATEFNEAKNEVLEWEKDPNSDIELSVIFPVYNVAKYLDKCFESVTAWKAPYVEFLFVNDGSPDNSAEIIKEWSKKDPRVKLLDKPNGGCASARQWGLDRSNGRYIGLIDPDDFIEPTMFKKLLSRAMVGSYDIAYAGYNEFYEDTQTYKNVLDAIYPVYVNGTSDVNVIDDLIAIQRVAIWRGIYKKELLINNNIGFHTELRRFDDLPFKVETFARAKSVVCVPEHLYYYRLGREGQDVSANDERLYVHFDIFNILDKFFEGSFRSHNQKMRYYQAKVNTHYWGITTIKPELRKDYLKEASKQLGIKNSKKAFTKLIKKYFAKPEVIKYKKCM